MASTKTVTGKVTGFDGTNKGAAAVVITPSQACYIAGTQEVVPSRVMPTVAADGSWSAQLYANNDLTPNGTYYTVQMASLDGGYQILTIQVPQTAGPFEVANIVTSTPTASPTPNHVSTLTVDAAATFTAGPISAPAGSIPLSAVSGAAADAAVVHLAGSESITGTKTFSTNPVFNTAGIPLSAVNGNPISVLDKGASSGASAATNTTAIQNAATAAGANGVVLFPPGSGIFVVNALTISAAGQKWIISTGCTLQLANAQNADVITISANDVTITGGGIIDGNQANQTTTSRGVNAASVSRPRVEYLTFNNCRDYSVRYATVTRGWVENVVSNRVGVYVGLASTDVSLRGVHGSVTTGNAILVDGGAATYSSKGGANTCYRIHAIDCYGSGGAGIYYNNVFDGSIVGCTSESSSDSGIDLEMCSHVTVQGNTSRGNTNQGISCYQGNSFCSIIGNICRGNTHGIIVDNLAAGAVSAPCNYLTIMANSCQGNSSNGIFVRNLNGAANSVSDIVIEGNVCTGGTAAGMTLGNSVTNLTVRGNRCGNNGTYGITFNGATNLLVEGNDLRGNTTAAVTGDGTLTTSAVRNNPGWNSRGNTSVSLSSGVDFTNNGPYDLEFVIANGSGVSTTLKGIGGVGSLNTGLGTGTFVVPVGGVINVTWTGAPNIGAYSL